MKKTSKEVILRAVLLVALIAFLLYGIVTTAKEARCNAAIQIYVIKAISKRAILPDTPVSLFPLIHRKGNDTIELSACRGEYEPASFVIRPDIALAGVTIEPTDFKRSDGTILSKSVVDVRVVKCWYQAGNSPKMYKGQKILVPELLLKDDSVVKVDYNSKMNYLKVRINNNIQYIDITSNDSTFPKNARIYDAAELQPFEVQANTNKQIWCTFHIPDAAESGTYYGDLLIRSRGKMLSTIKVNVNVLPFDLSEAPIEYGIYYEGRLQKGVVSEIGYGPKSAKQYMIELQDMKDHGVKYPTFSQEYCCMFDEALSVRAKVGLPDDKLYAMGISTEYVTDDARLKALSQNILNWRNRIAKHGYRTLYIYGKDEAKGDALKAQRPILQRAIAAGAKTFVACDRGAADIIGEVLSLAILGGPFKPDEVQKWHAAGKKVFIYGYPQVGLEDPDVYRRNYGLMAFCNGYDGVMNYAYQKAFGNIWNDFDSKQGRENFRDHVFAYPTSDGLIGTVEWEGFREAVDDVRYLATLARIGDSSAYSSTCSSLSTDSDLYVVRQTIIDKIKAIHSKRRNN